MVYYSISRIWYAVLFLLSFLGISLHNPFPFDLLKFEEIPVMEVNFYMMGRTRAALKEINALKDNVEYLNREFEGKIKFEMNQYVVNEGFALLPDLHREYIGVEELTVDSLVKNIESQGSINVFIFDSYVIEDLDAELMGFTPIFKAKHSDYELVSPSFDRIFIAYSALEKKTTLVHEMGHFLGLDHPWEMTDTNRNLMGLSSQDLTEKNHMAYGFKVSEFTDEQLEKMQHFALEFRTYLVKKREYKFEENYVFNVAN